MRIVSLLPSTTEILFAVGAGDDVVGVTFECDYPPQARTRTNVSTSTMAEGLSPEQVDADVSAKLAAGQDLYRLDAGALRALDPDLVVTQDLCAVCAVDVDNVDAALAHLGCRAEVLTIDPSTLGEVLDSMLTLGRATGRVEQADRLVESLRVRLEHVGAAVANHARPRIAVLESTAPLFTAGHWVPDMVTAAGGAPTLGQSGERSKRTSPQAIADAGAELVVVAPCGYDLSGATELARQAAESGVLPAGAPVYAVDADAAFVRPGPRLVDGIETLAAIAHPDALPARPELSTRS
jgi:iron complex transport system substrate-binding protein